MKKTYLIFFAILFSQTIYSQSNISGNVTDAESNPVVYGNAILYNAIDSTIVKAEFTDDAGNFLISKVENGSYWVQISYVGFPTANSDVFTIAGQDLKVTDIQLLPPSNALEEVTVVAKRPLLEMKADKMVFNVEGSINAIGSDALELLRKAPGVQVDHNENINLMGKSGVQVYIDGKPSPLSNADLAMYLKTLQSSEIDKIEIITNPSAKYDAEGNAGIIDIRLKRKNKNGAKTNLSLHGWKGIKQGLNGSVNTAIKKGKFNYFVSANTGTGQNTNDLNIYREQSGFIMDQSGSSVSDWNYYSSRAGVDYYLNDKHTIGILANYSRNNSTWESLSTTPFSQTTSRSIIDSVLTAQVANEVVDINQNYNANYAFRGSDGSSLNIDLDYGRYDRMTEEAQPNVYTIPEDADAKREVAFYTESPKLIQIYTAKLDYEKTVLNGTFGIGGKYSFVNTDNTFDLFNEVDDQRIIDPLRSNNFEYGEKVSAVYLSYAKQFGKLGFQGGLRMEHTNSKGDLKTMQTGNDQVVERSYTNLFPSFGLNYPLNQKHNLNFSYSRRLNRPNYADLNPFRSFIDQITFEQGNPFLNPEYSNNVQLTHTFNQTVNTSLSFGYTTDKIARITEAENFTNSLITWKNIAEQYAYNVNVSMPKQISEKWNTYISMGGSYTQNKATFENGTIDLSATTFNAYNQHTFTLPGSWNMEVSGWYMSPSVWEGNFKMNAMWSMDIGVQKEILNGAGKIKLAVQDPFKTNTWEGRTSFGTQELHASGNWDSRRLKVSFNYAFGKKDLKTRNRKTGLEEEAGRIKGEN